MHKGMATRRLQCWSVIDPFSSKLGRTDSTVLVPFPPGQSRRKTAT